MEGFVIVNSTAGRTLFLMEMNVDGGTCFVEYFLDLSSQGQVYVEIRLQVPSGSLKIPDGEGFFFPLLRFFILFNLSFPQKSKSSSSEKKI